MSERNAPSNGWRRLAPSTAERFAGGMSESRRPTGVWLATLFAFAMFIAISVLGLLIWFLYTLVSGVLAGLATRGVPSAPPEPGMVVESLGFIAAWLLAWLWLRKKERRPFASLGFRERSVAGRQILRGVLVALLMVGVALGVGVATGDLAFQPSEAGLINWGATAPVLFALLIFGVQGGAEELIARGYLLQAWYRRFGIVIAIVVQALFFVLLHAGNPGFTAFSALQLALFATLTAFWALNDGALWGVIALHATWNWALGSVFGTSVSGMGALPDRLFTVTETPGANPWITGGAFGLEASVTVCVILTGTAIGAGVIFVGKQRAAIGAAAERSHAAAVARD